MRLPSYTIIADEKIKNYLFAEKKKNDKSKWLKNVGYNISNWQKLKVDLSTQILPFDAALIDETKYGQMFEINGILKGPNSKSLKVCTIWMIEKESKKTKFITMYPKR